jgi:S1-C subfamily serine protease
MRMHRPIAAALTALTLAGCSGGTAGPTTLAPLTVPDVSAPTTIPRTGDPVDELEKVPVEPGEVIDSLDKAYAAVVRIKADGEFVHPVGLDLPASELVAGRGSGFSIGDNVVVTLSQVVAGSTTVEVFVDGEDEPRTGTVRAVDECGGVALVAVDGEPLPVLQWYDEDRVRTGLPVFSAGYPAIESTYGPEGEFLQSGGYIEDETTPAATSWADPGLLVTYTAPAMVGMYGGPLLDESGRVVAVIGARDQGLFRQRNNALFAGLVIPAVDRLLTVPQTVAGLGINMQAVETDTGLAGLWVAAVASGSFAERSGLKAGDLITGFGNPGTFAYGAPEVSGYCRTVRAAQNKGNLASQRIDFARYDNGDRYSTAVGSAARVTVAGPGTPGAPYGWASNDGYTDVTLDEFKFVGLDLPVAWGDRRSAPVAVDQVAGSFLLATTKVRQFETADRTVPGARAKATSAYRPERYDLDALLARAVAEAGVEADCDDPVDVTVDPTKFASPVARVVEYANCGERDTRYTIAVGHLTRINTPGAGFTIEVQTVHAAMHPLALELVRRAKVTGWP